MSSKLYRILKEPQFGISCSVSGCCGDTNLQISQKVQNGAGRIVANSAYDASASDIIQTLSWLNIPDMIKAEISTMALVKINGLAPEYLSEL